MSAARANGDNVGVMQYALQCMYFMLWVCLSASNYDQVLGLCICFIVSLCLFCSCTVFNHINNP